MRTKTRRWKRGPSAICVGCLVALLSALVAWESLLAQDSVGLDGVAADVAGAILKSSRGSPSPVRVAVADFTEKDGKITPLGVRLADEFSVALGKYAKGFDVVDHSRLEGTSPDDLADPNALKCDIGEPSTPVVVLGTVEELPDRLVLWVRGQEFHVPIFERRLVIPLTDEMKTLSLQPHRDSVEPVWVSPGHPPIANVEPEKSGAKGYTYPSCIQCPIAEYSDPAAKAKVQGTVVLDVIIGADGFPAKITVIRGLPCGLSQAAIKSVQQWRFQPATGPDGKPVEVLQRVEVSFRLS
jgi:TonB family protein